MLTSSTDIGAIYKRIFNHRAIIQNEILFFIEEFEVILVHKDFYCLSTVIIFTVDEKG